MITTSTCWHSTNSVFSDPYAVHFALIKPSDLILVDHEGKPQQATTRKVNAAGFIIHSSIHKARPDLGAVCHVHSPYGRAWSTFGRGIEMLNQGKRDHLLLQIFRGTIEPIY